jgi:hypothetical protein
LNAAAIKPAGFAFLSKISDKDLTTEAAEKAV